MMCAVSGLAFPSSRCLTFHLFVPVFVDAASFPAVFLTRLFCGARFGNQDNNAAL